MPRDGESNPSWKARDGIPHRNQEKHPKIENARDRSLWRLNLDGRVVQPAVASLGYPSGEPAAFAAAPSSGCAGTVLSACAYSPALRLDRRPTSPARIGVVSPGSVGGKQPAFTACYALPIDWLPAFQLALAPCLQLGLRLLPTHIWRRPSARLARTTCGLRRLLLQLRACAFCCRNSPACTGRCRLCQTGCELPTRIGCSTSGFTGFKSPELAPLRFYLRLGLRCAPSFN